MISQTHPSQIMTYCPKCGAHDFHFDGKKKFVCSACAFEYYINQAAAVCAIIALPDGKIILSRRKYDPMKGMLDLP